MIIYKATNKKDGKVYIGQTKQELKDRAAQHYREARCEKKKTTPFHKALVENSIDDFNFEIIDETDNQCDADEKERYWISFYQSQDPQCGYNLDSGGLRGGTKSDCTKQKIGESSKRKWQDPIIAEKMRDGLRKGALTQKGKRQLYPFVCPICNRTFYYQKYIVNEKKYCSIECATKSGAWKKGVEQSAKALHERNLQRKSIIKKDILKWALDNYAIVLACPFNKINSSLVGLKRLLFDRYEIKDLRSVFICFDVKNYKELLLKLKKYVCTFKENVC